MSQGSFRHLLICTTPSGCSLMKPSACPTSKIQIGVICLRYGAAKLLLAPICSLFAYKLLLSITYILSIALCTISHPTSHTNSNNMNRRVPSENETEIPLRITKCHLSPDREDAIACSRDAYELARVGKREVLKVQNIRSKCSSFLSSDLTDIVPQRRFGLASTVGFACSLMLTWEAVIMSVLPFDVSDKLT